MEHITKILNELGFELEKLQPHINGERKIMAPNKLVLVGRSVKDNRRVIIKMSSLIKGKKEIQEEKRARDTLTSFMFSKETILFPEEVLFGEHKSYLILVTEFIEQKKIFVANSLRKQFSLILKTFESREVFNTTAVGHIQGVLKTFPIFDTKSYLTDFNNFCKAVGGKTMKDARAVLKDNEEVIEKYCKHLVHTDFAPHNFRIKDDSLYILDCSAFHFGNKYEELARLLNYMVIHNPDLEKLIREFILANRGEGEYLDLRLMRIYKAGFLLKFYSQALKKTSGALYELTSARIDFWNEVLKSLMEDKELDEKILEGYIKDRDALRSEEEKIRQREFAIA